MEAGGHTHSALSCVLQYLRCEKVPVFRLESEGESKGEVDSEPGEVRACKTRIPDHSTDAIL